MLVKVVKLSGYLDLNIIIGSGFVDFYLEQLTFMMVHNELLCCFKFVILWTRPQVLNYFGLRVVHLQGIVLNISCGYRRTHRIPASSLMTAYILR